MWTIDDIVASPRIQELIQLPYEASVVLCITPDRLYGTELCTGNDEGVYLPLVSKVAALCRRHRSNKVIVIHNHPPIDGRVSPYASEEDALATRQYRDQLCARGIGLVDHIIVSQAGVFSFKAAGYL